MVSVGRKYDHVVSLLRFYSREKTVLLAIFEKNSFVSAEEEYNVYQGSGSERRPHL